MKRRNLELFGTILLAVIGLLHLVQAPEEYAAAPYLSILFGVNFLAMMLAIVGVRQRKQWGWLLGLAVAVGSLTGYVLSRTTGIAGMAVGAWLLPIGVVSLVAEAAFMIVAFVAWPHVADRKPAPAVQVAAIRSLARIRWLWLPETIESTGRKMRVRYLVPSAILVSILAAGLVVGYLQVRVVPITQEALAEEYGLRVTQISTTMLDGIVDVRMQIVDANKASPIFNDHESMPYLMVDETDTVIPPVDHHGHTKTLIEGKTYAMFFPNPDRVVRADSTVSVVFGQQKLTPISVQ